MGGARPVPRGQRFSSGACTEWGRVQVAAIGVVGNEDGAHHVTAEVAQALSDVGFTIPAQAATYWVGEAMQAVDYKDLDTTPEKTAGTTEVLARNATHLAGLLASSPYPAA